MSKEKAIILGAVITGIFGCVVAFIGLGTPIVEKMVNDNVSAVEISLQQTSVALQQTQAVLNFVEVSSPATSPPATVAPSIIPSSTVVQETNSSSSDLRAEHYILGYTEKDLAAKQILAVCKEPSCYVIFIQSLDELPNDWYHITGNVASATENLPDGCRTKQDLINLKVIYMQANNYTPCP